MREAASRSRCRFVSAAITCCLPAASRESWPAGTPDRRPDLHEFRTNDRDNSRSTRRPAVRAFSIVEQQRKGSGYFGSLDPENFNRTTPGGSPTNSRTTRSSPTTARAAGRLLERRRSNWWCWKQASPIYAAPGDQQAKNGFRKRRALSQRRVLWATFQPACRAQREPVWVDGNPDQRRARPRTVLIRRRPRGRSFCVYFQIQSFA